MDGLKFVIKRQWITRIDNFKPVAKSKNYLYAKFVFSSDEWTGIKTALFASSNTERPVPMLLDENGICRVPHEVLDWDVEGDFTVSVFCGDLITANKASVHVYETGYTDDAGQEEPPTPSIYAQILARLHGVENLEVYAETLPEGSEASVEKSLDPETEGYVFNFGIPKGDKGDTGFAPRVTVENITGGHRITIQDATQTYVFNVMDGVNGEDGYSPTITVGDITGGHRVVITDKNGEHIFNVMDGQDYVLTQADKEEIAAMVDLSDYAKKTDLDSKVDKVTGKGLSTNDYTTEEKNKLSGIEAGAKANVQSDWDQTDISADDYIKNKPEIPPAVTVDDELPDESENPVQNKVIDAEIGDLKAEINHKIDKPQTAGTSGQVLTSDGQGGQSWQTPADCDVTDVQINGTSIVNQGVANVPLATGAVPGVVSVSSTFGLQMNPNLPDMLMTQPASLTNIKNGDAGEEYNQRNYRVITPAIQHNSIFYGLARAASDTTQSSSSNPVGTYTDEAKVAIQKMLGIYEPPYELLNDITLDAESGIDLTADSNGTPYNLLGVFIYVFYTADVVSATTGYGRYRLYDNNSRYCNAETGKYTSGSAKFKHLLLDRRNNLAFFDYTAATASGGQATWVVKSGGTNITLDQSYNGALIGLGNIVRIGLASGDVEPAGTRIQIYGQRAY